ncbi:MAG: DUF2207 domain-containing protein, partial [Campylobacterales bacterium]|nr:DUF2207 domain-containing protein [Campylobacterales bacterium]
LFTLGLYAEKIEKYNIDLTLEQSGKLKIREDILYNFENEQRRGIYRDIPYRIKIDGLYNRDIGINNVRILRDNGDDQLKLIYPDDKNLRIRIGDPNKFLTGKHTYSIFYSVEKGVLKHNQTHDITSWNIIGTQWKVPINKVTAFIYLPPSLSQHNTTIKLYTGVVGSTTNKAKGVWIDNHTYRIEASYLMAYEGLSADIIYPINILDQSGQANSAIGIKDQITRTWNWFAIFVLSLMSYRFWLGFGANDFKRMVSTQYRAPNNLSVLQSGLIFDKFANDKDFSAAIIELGHKGYLTITKGDDSSLPSFKKLQKDQTELTPDMRYLLNDILFDRDDTFKLKKDSNAQARKLSNGFDKINDMLYDWSLNQDYMQNNPKKARKNFLIRMILLAIPFLGISVYASLSLLGVEITIVSIFFSVFLVVGLIVFFTTKGWFGSLFALMFIGISGASTLPAFLDQGQLSNVLYTPLFLIVVFTLMVWFTYKRIGKYTQRGSVTKSQLDGLQRFIKRVKADEIERNLKRDPLFLERYLTYAVLFGEAKHWLKFYTQLGVEEPIWYHGNMNNMHLLSNDMQQASTVHESSSGGYSSGGGGFSGGGMGGGGGGSW